MTENSDLTADHYAILQVRNDADTEVIQAAYRRLSRKYNAEAVDDPEAARKLRELKAAYAVVGSPVRRAEYDAAIRRDVPAAAQAGPPAAVHAPPAVEPYEGPPSGESVTDGEWVQWLEGAFPLAFASALVVVCIIGIYNGWNQLP